MLISLTTTLIISYLGFPQRPNPRTRDEPESLDAGGSLPPGRHETAAWVRFAESPRRRRRPLSRVRFGKSGLRGGVSRVRFAKKRSRVKTRLLYRAAAPKGAGGGGGSPWRSRPIRMRRHYSPITHLPNLARETILAGPAEVGAAGVLCYYSGIAEGRLNKTHGQSSAVGELSDNCPL
jgi:hypothetical protein